MSTPRVRLVCGTCLGRRSIIDPDPYADRRQFVTCPVCGGSGSAPVSTPVAHVKAAAIPRGVKLLGWHSIHQKHVAALVGEVLIPKHLSTVYKLLVPDARQQIRLARKWDLWGLLATDAWASAFGAQATPPNQKAKGAP